MVRFHAKRKGRADGSTSTVKEHEESTYVFQGWELDMMKLKYDFPKVPLWDKESYIAKYENKNAEIRAYFKNRPDAFLYLNLNRVNGFESLLRFLQIEASHTHLTGFPHLNKSTRS